MLGMEAPTPFDPRSCGCSRSAPSRSRPPAAAGGSGFAAASGCRSSSGRTSRRSSATPHWCTPLPWCLRRRRATPRLRAESAAAVWGLPRVEAVAHDGADLGHDRAAARLRASDRSSVPRSSRSPSGVCWSRRWPGTVVDLACKGSLPSAVAAADHALRHGLCSLAELRAEADAVRVACAAVPPRGWWPISPMPTRCRCGESLSRVQMFRLGVTETTSSRCTTTTTWA